VLDYFEIESVNDSVRFSHAARKNDHEEKADLQLAWLFRVRQLARALQVPRYSEKHLRSVLADLQSLMEEPEEIRHVPRALAQAGVRFVIVEAVPGSEIQGVCFWIDGGKAPVIGLSLSFGRIDNAWFNIRHEIEHVLNGDGKDQPIVDDSATLSGSSNQLEQERLANEAAAEFCVPQRKLDDFIARLDPMYSTTSFLGFARLVQRHPGIVAGQLQRRTERWELFRKFQVDIRKALVGSALTDGFGRIAPAVV
jgi:HTH-type transcriptional regulator/antitoxin HigA